MRITKLFGTDGVRGAVGSFLTAELALRVASAAVAVCRKVSESPVRTVIVRDPRESGEMLETAITAGIVEDGGMVYRAGVLPTPVVPLLIERYKFDLGIVISASHNQYSDNGIKFFGPDGYKLSDDHQREIERLVDIGPPKVACALGTVETLHGAGEDYLRALAEHFSTLKLDGLRVAVDCANGATSTCAPEILKRLGATVKAIHCDPDGRNINDGCGSTYPEAISACVKDGSFDLGFAFDGDGDRVLAVDRNGRILDGDELIAIIALSQKRTGKLVGDGIAVTVMSNFGLHKRLTAAGIEVSATAVGDRNVLAELRRCNWGLGGEQSGHIIDRSFVPSGDGIAAMLLTLEALAGEDLSTQNPFMKLPQKLINIRTARRVDPTQDSVINDLIAEEARMLDGRGRILIRASGTESLIRVMVEAPEVEEADMICRRLASMVEDRLGSN